MKPLAVLPCIAVTTFGLRKASESIGQSKPK